MSAPPEGTPGAMPRSSYRVQQIDAQIQTLNESFAILKKTGGGSVLEGAKRGGFGDIMMRMRRLPFEKFYLKKRVSQHIGEQTWIIGMTREIRCDLGMPHIGLSGSNVSDKTYNLGKYFIAVLSEAIGSHNPTFHLMPESDPTTLARHMHHHVDSGSRGNSGKTNPLDWTPMNCYGSFEPAIKGTFINADIPELFRMLHLFTKALNPNSPLLRLPQLPHISEVTNET